MTQNTLHCEFHDSGFRATAIRSCGSRLIRVAGAGLAPSAGWSLELTAANPGVVAHPESLWLGLTEHAPADGRARVRTAVPVEAIIEDSDATEIVVRFGWRDPITVPVIETDVTIPAGTARRAYASA
ncbi:hypothetical protein ET445_05950 [Agromyces protaetiae]|uniref:Uncharacterized protein n=1 Tax=Agromyces protaetiae TaxID=2509455 RepID=A0A4P6FD97_9MICO|nr:hypothetical protein [Agromyces protaetiae]QAY72953.1 hypothetical protein ET445_05950 [Agromyces protaetiae]